MAIDDSPECWRVIGIVRSSVKKVCIVKEISVVYLVIYSFCCGSHRTCLHLSYAKPDHNWSFLSQGLSEFMSEISESPWVNNRSRRKWDMAERSLEGDRIY